MKDSMKVKLLAWPLISAAIFLAHDPKGLGAITLSLFSGGLLFVAAEAERNERARGPR